MRLRALMLASGLVFAQAAQAQPADAPGGNWQITLTQMAANGQPVSKPADIACAQSGCAAPVSLMVGNAARPFLASFTFVQRGAYLTLQALSPEVGKVVGFEDGYQGPIFVATRADRSTQILRFTLTGVPDAHASGPALMDNTQSLVFHRKMDPDLSLQLVLVKPAAKG